jgi:hypothetical protein
MGGALIYAIATQTPQERALLRQPSTPLQRSEKGLSARQPAPNTTPAAGTQDLEMSGSAPPAQSGEIFDAFVARPKISTARPSVSHSNSIAPLDRSNTTSVSALPTTPEPRSSTEGASLRAAQASTIQPWVAEPVKSQNHIDDKAMHATATPASALHTVTLWSGTPLTVKIADTLSTDQAKKGQVFRATLQSPVVSDGFVIADAGSVVTGQIIESKRAGKLGGAPDLSLVLVEIRTTDNQSVHIETRSWEDRGQSHNLVMAPIRSAIGAVSGAVTSAARASGIGPEQDGEPTVKNGRNVVLPANTILQFRLAAPVSLTEQAH